ncbi:MAG: sugar phosphate isomerase/epimerase family protein [Tropicimonas sp.]|uniref:sugar phosphate isomerase/epimerase family protein n=1 Tax=Tropicimonas sp. TaxID=2067044 RepID=UPI003A8497E7
MRLGGVAIHPGSIEGLEGFCTLADDHGLSAIVAPAGLDRMDEEAAAAWGEAARNAGLVIGEAGFWENLQTPDGDLAADRLARLRRTLRNAEVMGCRSVAILPGTHHPSDKGFAADAFIRSKEGRCAVLATIRAALDGVDPASTRLGMEPYAASFFYRPEEVLDFLDEVDDPRFGLHLDLANMLTVDTFFDSRAMIEHWMPDLAPHAVSCHLKDLTRPVSPLGLAFAEVDLGNGAIDAFLPADMTVFCEHFATEQDYFRNFDLAHALAGAQGVNFLARHPSKGDVT